MLDAFVKKVITVDERDRTTETPATSWAWSKFEVAECLTLKPFNTLEGMVIPVCSGHGIELFTK